MSSNKTSKSSVEGFFTRLLRAGFEVDAALTPCLCVFGILGNSLSIALFSLNPEYRSQTSSYCLSALAISDTGFLLNLLAVWIENMYGGILTSAFMCRLVMYLGQVTCFVSIYVLVGFSIERCVAVHNPLSRQSICTKSRARRGLLGVTLVALFLFSYAWLIAEVVKIKPNPESGNLEQNESSLATLRMIYMGNIDLEEDVFNKSYWSQGAKLKGIVLDPSNETSDDNSYNSFENFLKNLLPTFGPHNQTDREQAFNLSRTSYYYCSVPKKYHGISQIANYADTVITLIIPFFLIAYCNLRIVITLRKLETERQLFLSSLPCCTEVDETLPATDLNTLNQSKTESQTPHLQPLQNVTGSSGYPSKQSVSEARATHLLVLVSSAFLALHLPLHVIRCAQFVRKLLIGSREGHDVLAALQPWANLLFNINFAFNFVLYCLSGKSFRQALRQTASNKLAKFKKNPTRPTLPSSMHHGNKQNPDGGAKREVETTVSNTDSLDNLGSNLNNGGEPQLDVI